LHGEGGRHTRQGMRPSAAIHAFGWGVLASCFVSGQVSELPPLRPVVGGADGLTGDAGADPEPEPQNPKDCHFWQYCWKLTVPSAQHDRIALSRRSPFPICLNVLPAVIRTDGAAWANSHSRGLIFLWSLHHRLLLCVKQVLLRDRRRGAAKAV